MEVAFFDSNNAIPDVESNQRPRTPNSIQQETNTQTRGESALAGSHESRSTRQSNDNSNINIAVDSTSNPVGGRLRGGIFLVFALASLVPPSCLAISLLKPKLLPFMPTIPTSENEYQGDIYHYFDGVTNNNTFNPRVHFTTKLAAGLLMSQVGISLILLLPLLSSTLFCCFWFGTNTNLSSKSIAWNGARVSCIFSFWLDLLLIVVALLVFSPSTNNNDETSNTTMFLYVKEHGLSTFDKDRSSHLIEWYLLASSAGGMLCAALALMVSFWPSSQGNPRVFQRHTYQVLQTVTSPGGEQQQDEESNFDSLLEPQPDGPTIATVDPDGIFNVTSFKMN